MNYHLIKKKTFEISFGITIFFFIFFWDFKNLSYGIDVRLLLLVLLPFFYKDFFKINKLALGVIIFMIAHLIITSIIYLNPITQKSIAQIFFIYYLIIFSFRFKNDVFRIMPNLVRIFIILFTALSLFNLAPFVIKESTSASSACSLFLDMSLTGNNFIFTENSHFGMIGAALSIFFIFSIKNNKIISEIILFICLLFLNIVYSSTTLKVGIIASSIVMIIFLFNKKYIKNFIFLSLILFVNAVPFFLSEQCHSRITRFDAVKIIKLSSIQKDKIEKTKKERQIKINNNIDSNGGKTSKFYQIREDLVQSIIKGDDNEFERIKNLILINCEVKDLRDKDFCNEEIKNEIIKNMMIEESNYETTNITVDVYENAFYTMTNVLMNKPLGYGIDNYKFAFDYYSPINYFELNLSNDNKKFRPPPWEVLTLNRSDGRSNFIKLFTEFGYFAIFLLLFFVACTFTKKISISEKSFFIPLLITQLISGAGYFNGGFIITICLMSGLFFKEQNNTK
ncbi:hypothetical protein IDH14_05015 [Pelagibacterales bacterium SAG-MED33]|nr:hypothetical protein [Pelagibacterales bacterium SAG-MED33]